MKTKQTWIQIQNKNLGAIELAKFVATTNNKLDYINLSSNKIGKDGIIQLCNAFRDRVKVKGKTTKKQKKKKKQLKKQRDLNYFYF